MTEYLETPPTFQQFRMDLQNICPDGDLEKAHQLLIIALNGEKLTTEGAPLSWSYILKKYSDHIAQWSDIYGKRDKQYIATKDLDKKKNIQDFIEKSLYNREYVIQKGTASRNQYIFGSLPTYNLMKQLSDFKKEYSKKV